MEHEGLFSPPSLYVSERKDGGLLLRSAMPLDDLPPRYGDVIRLWSRRAPERTALAEHPPSGATLECTWAELETRVARLAMGLLGHGMPRDRPIVVLAPPSIDHVVLSLAAMEIGWPIAPLAPTYAAGGADRDKLAHLIDLLDPKLIVVDRPEPYVDALAPVMDGRELLSFEAEAAHSSVSLEAIETEPTEALRLARQAVGPQTIAKIMLTSGSTGFPKGVITTHQMLLANQQALRQVYPFLGDHPPRIVDWLPFNHCYAGNFNLGIALFNGGTYRMVRGQPVDEAFGPVLDVLADYPPTIHLDVPQGFGCIADRLETDDSFGRRFFGDLDLMFYAGSTMPEPLWHRLQAASRRVVGRTIPITTGYGSTETTPLHTVATSASPGPRHIGTPVPGSEVLLLADGDRYEIRLRGMNVTPGYWKDQERTREAFDADGFYVTGDAVRWVDQARPDKGLYFEGRVGLNFKLHSGTWVKVDAVRVDMLSELGDLARDVIVVGADKAFVGALIFPNLAHCKKIAGTGADMSPMEVLDLPGVREAFQAALARYNRKFSGSSRHVARAVLLDEDPRVYEAELTDKQYLNQRRAAARREAVVEGLFGPDPPPAAVVFEKSLR